MKVKHRKVDFDWGDMVWLIDDELVEAPGLSLAKMTVKPNALSDAHLHSDCTETIHVLSGQISQRRDNDWVELGVGETTFIPASMMHQTQAVGSCSAVLLIAYSSGSRDYRPVE